MGKSGKYYLEERAFKFARRFWNFIKAASNTISNKNDLYQLAKASNSVGANYIESNNSFSRKDFFLESLPQGGEEIEEGRPFRIQEFTELMKTFGAIIRKNGNEN